MYKWSENQNIWTFIYELFEHSIFHQQFTSFTTQYWKYFIMNLMFRIWRPLGNSRWGIHKAFLVLGYEKKLELKQYFKKVCKQLRTRQRGIDREKNGPKCENSLTFRLDVGNFNTSKSTTTCIYKTCLQSRITTHKHTRNKFLNNFWRFVCSS